MLDLGRFSAWVTIEDVEVPEYNVETKDGASATCWIASEVGKSFCVHWKDKTPQDVTNGTIRVDGAFVDSTVSRVGRDIPTKVSAARIASDKERELIFSHTEFTDDDAFLDQVSPELGTITVTIDYVNITKEASSVTASTRFAPYHTAKVHERSKKLSKHSVQFGPERSRNRTWVEVKTIKQAASFTFKYRPLEFLQVQEIAPRPKPPIVDSNQDDPQDIPDDDVKPEIVDETEIDAELQQLQERMDALKRKKKNNRVKREHAPVFLPGEIIDLT